MKYWKLIFILGVSFLVIITFILKGNKVMSNTYNNVDLEIITIGTHEYILLDRTASYGRSICHYEDCNNSTHCN